MLPRPQPMFADSLLKKHVIEQLIYGEIFAHPLTRSELMANLSFPEDQIEKALEELTSSGLIGVSDNFYFIFDKEDKIEKRLSGMKHCEKFISRAFRNGAFIGRFPYVKGVGISGSMSKGILHKDGDFDYFIITEQNRLWIARTLLILYKKLFLFNSRKFFCVNYFVDDASLEIQEKNRFTATEIHTLIPVSGIVFTDFYSENKWVGNFYNQQRVRPIPEKITKPWLIRSGERILSGSVGEWLDIQCMKLTLRRWKRKFGHFNDSTFHLALKTRRYVSKHHPNDFQTRVLKRFDELSDHFNSTYSEQLEAQGIRL